MYEFTLSEINFLRWLLDRNQAKISSELDVDIRLVLTEHQEELLASIQDKLIKNSSY